MSVDRSEYSRAYYLRNREIMRERARGWRERNPERRRENHRRWRERVKRGEIQLPELDWAICARGGSEAQAMAHRRRGEHPCAACKKAETEAHLRRRAARRNAS